MISTKVFPESILDRVKKSKALYAFGRRARFSIGSLLGARYVDKIGRVHFNDFMLRDTSAEAIADYHDNAVRFVHLLEDALASVGKRWPDVNAVLDIGCGYGRVVRELRRRVPASNIYVCDVIEDGANFTADEFSATAVPILDDANDGMLNDKFDLAYMLSVYTHTPDGFMGEHLRLVKMCLKPGGVFLFTTHGFVSATTCERYGQAWLDKADVVSTLAARGFCFRQYPHYLTTYGMAWCSEEYVKKAVAEAGLQLVSYTAAGHGGHQDVFVVMKG